MSGMLSPVGSRFLPARLLEAADVQRRARVDVLEQVLRQPPGVPSAELQLRRSRLARRVLRLGRAELRRSPLPAARVRRPVMQVADQLVVPVARLPLLHQVTRDRADGSRSLA
jgi:hypothetical protein